MDGEQRAPKRQRTEEQPAERSFGVPAVIENGARVEVFCRREGVPMGWCGICHRSIHRTYSPTGVPCG